MDRFGIYLLSQAAHRDSQTNKIPSVYLEVNYPAINCGASLTEGGRVLVYARRMGWDEHVNIFYFKRTIKDQATKNPPIATAKPDKYNIIKEILGGKSFL